MRRNELKTINKVAVVGTGVIGSGWAARFLASGMDVVATDPGRGAEGRLRRNIDIAWKALEEVGLHPNASIERLTFTTDLEQAVANVDFIQESAPEDEQFKCDLLKKIDRIAPFDVIIASSTSAFLPSRLQADLLHPARFLVGHPFNPVYLLPLVEIVPGTQTSGSVVERSETFYRTMGMRPLILKTEVYGFLANRLQEALWREALWLVSEGVATTEELDASVVYGCGLRWALMGTCLTFHLAGGDEGMKHMLEHFGPALKLPMTKLEGPELSPELFKRMVDGCDFQAAGRPVSELNARRDQFLVELLPLVKKYWPESEGIAGRI